MQQLQAKYAIANFDISGNCDILKKKNSSHYDI